MIIFVGDKPSAKMKSGAKPFEGASCEKLLFDWISFLTLHTPELFKIINSATPKDLENILFYSNQYLSHKCLITKVVALGNNASKKLYAHNVLHFKLPHPSGRNRQLNDKKFIDKKLAECREWLKLNTK